MKRKVLVIFILFSMLSKVNAQCGDSTVKKAIIKQIEKELFKTKFIQEKVKKREIFKGICNNNKRLKIYPIFWLGLNVGDTIGHCENSKTLFAKLKFLNKALEPVQDILAYGTSNILYEAMLYDDCVNPVISYSESKLFYVPSLQAKNLFKIIKANNISCAFYVVNFDKNHPYFLLDRSGEIFVYYDTYKHNEKKQFVFLKLSEYI